MSAFDMIVNFFKQGGAFLYPIAAVFAVGLGVGVERFIYLRRVARGNRRLWAELAPLIAAGNFKTAMLIAEKTDSALSTIMRYGMSRVATARRRDDIEKAMEESLLEVIPHLERRTHYLASLANVGMLMGLLGTVVGLISAFAAVAAVNPAEKAAMLSASISVAMNNTALGLGLAITLLLCHMYLETRTSELVDSLEVASLKFLNSVTEKQDLTAQAGAAQYAAMRIGAAQAGVVSAAAGGAQGSAAVRSRDDLRGANRA
jgi:biopolymer transport protein ExbB/TolQ